MMNFHVPVLKNEVIHYLINNKAGTYVDGTLGGGGHSQAILEILNQNGRLIGIDQDDEALDYSKKKLKKYHNQVTIQHGNFGQIKEILHDIDVVWVDGILLDLGVSSYQINEEKRGFSYIASGPLDMRMNKRQPFTAEHIVNKNNRDELFSIFKEYGEERFAKQIANAIVTVRKTKDIKDTQKLAEIIKKAVPGRFQIKSLSRIFQALRIKVNEELTNLRLALEQSVPLLKKGGRLVVISYHSLEDRIVKQFLQKTENPCTCPPAFPVCICDKKPLIKILTKRVIKPTSAEIDSNPRSRSARLRAAEKL